MKRLTKKQINQIATAWASGLLWSTDGTAFIDVPEVHDEDRQAIVDKVKDIGVQLYRRSGCTAVISLPRIIAEVLKTNDNAATPSKQ